MKIKNVKLKFNITVELACTSPGDFKSQEEFKEHDCYHMKPYLRDAILDALRDKWQYAAQVERVTMQPIKFVE